MGSRSRFGPGSVILLKRQNPAADPCEAIPLPERRQPAETQTPTPGRRARLHLSSSPGNSSPIYSSILDPGSNNNKKKAKNKLVILTYFGCKIPGSRFSKYGSERLKSRNFVYGRQITWPLVFPDVATNTEWL
jgi:hypothetical protein